MDNKLLLANGITLLYRESQIPGLTERSTNLVRNILSSIKLPDTALTLDSDTEQLHGLKRFLLSMCDDPLDHQYDLHEILQQLRIILGDDSNLYESLKESFSTVLDESALKRNRNNIHKRLSEHFREQNINTLIHKAGVALKFEREKIVDMRQWVAELCAALEPYQQDIVTKDPAIVSHVAFNNLDSVKDVFHEIQKQAQGTSIMQTGYQALNRMLRGGFRRGEQVLISALQHNFKTGFTLSLFKQIALYNRPEMIDPTKKPLLLRISFEDDLTNNLQFLYTSLKENETKQKVTEDELSNISPEELARYVKEKLEVNGYHIEMLRVDPSQWTYLHICNKLLEYEADGYEIHVCMLDYLYMVPTTGCSQGPAGHDVRDMFRRMRNYCSPRKITLITPHQISTAGKALIREDREDFVKLIANKGYYAGSSQIDQEVDLEIYIHIEKVNGRSWLTVQRGKHRIPGATPEEDKYFVMLFEDIGTIPDDLNGIDSSRKKPGAGLRGTADATPFWSLENDY